MVPRRGTEDLPRGLHRGRRPWKSRRNGCLGAQSEWVRSNGCKHRSSPRTTKRKRRFVRLRLVDPVGGKIGSCIAMRNGMRCDERNLRGRMASYFQTLSASNKFGKLEHTVAMGECTTAIGSPWYFPDPEQVGITCLTPGSSNPVQSLSEGRDQRPGWKVEGNWLEVVELNLPVGIVRRMSNAMNGGQSIDPMFEKSLI